MSRLAFAIIGQTAEEILLGLPCKIKDEQTGEFVASTNSEDGYEFTIQNNNDSSYFVDGLPMGTYSIYAGSDQVPQDELRYKVFLNEGALAHFNDAMAAGAKVWHHVLNDSQTSLAEVWSSKLISDLLETKATVASVTAVVEALDQKSDSGHTHDTYAVKEAGSYMVAEAGQKLGVNIHADDFETREGKLGIKQDFNSPTILDETKTLNQNLERLQAALEAIPSVPSNFLNLTPVTGHYTETVANIGKVYYRRDSAAAQPRTYGIYAIIEDPDDANAAVRITLGTEVGADGSA